MRVGIFGGNGYLGNLVASVLSEFHEVSYLERGKLDLINLDFIIDCSVPRDLHKKRIREDYFKLVSNRLEMAKKLDVKYIYIGSFSSSSMSKSHYGRVKFKCENEVIRHGGSILRLPLIIEKESLGSRTLELDKLVKKMPIIFLPHESRFRLQISDPQTFLNSLNRLVNNVEYKESGEYVGNYESVSLKELILSLPSSEGKKIVMLNRTQSIFLEFVLKIIPLGRLNNIRSLLGGKSV